MPFISRSMSVSPSRKPNPHRFGPPTDTTHRHRRKEEDPHLHREEIQQAKLEQLCSARLIHRDLKVVKLDMQGFK
jgi:hypothetical protein